MKKIALIFSFLTLIAITISCEKDYNNWEVDSSHDRLFKSILFEPITIKPTSVEIKFTKSISATKYVFEFSKDNSQFNEIVKTVEILASNLKPFATSSDQTKVEYREVFDELDGTTGYSVRMKSIDEISGKESKYSQAVFTTPAEQLFIGYTATTTSVKLKWTISPRVSNVTLFDGAGVLVKNFVLTPDQITTGTMTIDNLANGTNYVAKIYNGTIIRGSLNVKTTGIPNSTVYKVLITDTASSIGLALQGLVATGANNITVEFAAGTAYTIGGDVTIPTGVNNIAFVGSADANGILPSVTNIRFRVQTTVNDISVQNLSTTSAGSYFFDLPIKTVHDIQIEGCTIFDINSIMRASGATVINNVTVNNCLISKTGGFGVMNVGAGGTVNAITVSNCTLTEISTRFADVRVKTTVTFKNITCVNVTMAMQHLWNFDNNFPVQVFIQNCILAGPNGGTALNSTNGTYSNITVNYASNYMTKDLIIGTRPLTSITVIPLNIADFFVDPTKGDYHIKPGIGFTGAGVAGDPRWF